MKPSVIPCEHSVSALLERTCLEPGCLNIDWLLKFTVKQKVRSISQCSPLWTRHRWPMTIPQKFWLAFVGQSIYEMWPELKWRGQICREMEVISVGKSTSGTPLSLASQISKARWSSLPGRRRLVSGVLSWKTSWPTIIAQLRWELEQTSASNTFSWTKSF